MNWFRSNDFTVVIEAPGRLRYREANREFVFPWFKEDGNFVLVDFPISSRRYLFFGWYSWRVEFSSATKEQVLVRIQEYLTRTGRTVRILEAPQTDEKLLAFHPELFEQRAIAVEALTSVNVIWFSDYSSIDLRHEDYGLEICGIQAGEKVEVIRKAMTEAFPHWHFTKVCLNRGDRDPGWKFIIHMFRERCSGGNCET